MKYSGSWQQVMRIEFLDVAKTDLADAITHYNMLQDNLGNEFLTEIKRTLKRIVDYPEAWPLISKQTRRCQTNRFPHGIIYRYQPDMLLIVAVMHLHSEPNKWHKRL